MKHRGGYGVTCYNLTEKSGDLTGIAAVDDSMDIMMITDSGTIIRTPVAGIPTRSRSAGGVIVMRLGEGQQLVNFTVVAREEEEDEAETVEVEENATEIVAEDSNQEAVVVENVAEAETSTPETEE